MISARRCKELTGAAGARRPTSRRLSRARTSATGPTGKARTAAATACRNARSRRKSAGASAWKRMISSQTRKPSNARFTFASISLSTASGIIKYHALTGVVFYVTPSALRVIPPRPDGRGSLSESCRRLGLMPLNAFRKAEGMAGDHVAALIRSISRVVE